ncbi:glycosyltransferase family 4 protein [Paenibacillus paeoniae]|uniref:Glycosyltransferase family 1 protein n=1 Tax=Paenibacillus paeoniae TaxID=2292705 RepID=A0A371P028_9BACL|nr:glycosyltransferase family 4 protein [Paenibacillus paeoniae]REK69275.1 glycosyltransferase family 1 protein [Paenibacillus paeoniae]
MKKVLFVATVVQKHIMVFHIPYLKWFKENGYETYVCAKNDYKNKNECNIPYCDHYIDLPFERSPINLKNIKVYRELKKIIDLNNFEVIHCHTPMGGVLTRLAAKESRNRGSKVLYTAHGFHFYKGAPLINWILYYPTEKYLSRFTDILITINNEDYEYAMKFKANQVEFVPGVGIDVNKFNDLKLAKENKRKELNIPEDSIVILSIGELTKRKNHELAIRAVSKLKNKNYVYLICGNGDLKDYLREASKNLNIEENVRFLGFRNDIPEICAASDIFVFPSFQEGLPVSIMEAMSAGLPIICSSIRGNTDLIENGINGFLFDVSDINDFSKKIEKLSSDSDLRKSMSAQNIEKAKMYDKSVVEEIMSGIYS